MIYILFNPLSDNKKGEQKAKEVAQKFQGSAFVDVTKINYKEFVSAIKEGDVIHLIGGDGTLSVFANAVYGESLPCEVFFHPAGTGNDFINDNKKYLLEDGSIKINDFIKNLPTVTVNDNEYKFINGIGFGLDGVCCEIGDEKKKKSSKPINYTLIALKLCLYAFKPRNATVTVDGEKLEFKKVWIAPTMKGKYFGGGMQVAPFQDRFFEDKNVTFVCVSNASRLTLLFAFPSIFKGKHTKFKCVKMIKAKEVEVEFDKPCALQIDGETFLNVKKYSVKI